MTGKTVYAMKLPTLCRSPSLRMVSSATVRLCNKAASFGIDSADCSPGSGASSIDVEAW